MCSPVALMAGSMFLTAAGGIQQMQAANAAARAGQQQAQQNARIAEAQAKTAEMQGVIDEDRRRNETRAMLGKQRATFAANNVDSASGSAIDILGDTAAIGEQDALTIRANAARQAWGYRAQGVNAINQAAVDSAAARNSGIGTLLTTAGSLAGTAYGYKSTAPAKS